MALYLYRLGKAAYLNPLKVIAAWLVVLGGLIGAGLAFSEPTADNFKIPGMPSEYAGKILEKNFGGAGADPFTESNATIVFRANDGTLRDPQNVRAMDTVLAEIAKIDHVVDPELVTNPVTAPMPDPATLPPRLRQQVEAQAQQQEIIAATKSTEQRQADEAVLSQVSGDARVARVDVEFGRKIYDLPKNTPDKIRAAAQKGRDLGIQVETEGSAAVGEKPPGGESEAIGVAVAALVLIITFGSLVAWGLPLINALIAVPVALFGIETATGFWRIGTFPEVLTIMIGLAVSIDYVLFIVSRYRHELTRRPTRERADRAEAAGIAVGTGGSAVIFAGLTVIVALAALAFIGVPFLGEMGVAAAWGVAVAVAVAVSFLPAVLGLFGTRVFAGRVKGLHPPDTPEGDAHTSLGSRWGTLVRRAPIVVCLAGVAILGVIAIPATDMKTALPGSSTSEKSTTERKAYDLIAQAWGPGAAGPLIVAVDGDRVDQPHRMGEYAALVKRFADDPAVRGRAANVQMIQVAPDNARAAVIAVTPRAAATAESTRLLVEQLRGMRSRVQQQTGMDYGVTGLAAAEIDVSNKLRDALPGYLATVVGLAFLLLVIAFRSILVPLTAALGFLLSVAATFGLTVGVFSKGWLGLVDNTQPLVSFLPIFLIGVIFGLAMDYQVFLVSRMREYYVDTGDARSAVVHGVRHGARVVTAAAIIMIAVFASFILNEQSFIKQIGFGLAVAVLFDAFIVRMMIIPAAMTMLGRAAWWLPRWLSRIIPNVDIEGERLSQALVGDRGPGARAAGSHLVSAPEEEPVAVPEPAAPVSGDAYTRAQIADLRATNDLLAAELAALRSDYRTITARQRLCDRAATDPTDFRVTGRSRAGARAGILACPNGEIQTPAFIGRWMPQRALESPVTGRSSGEGIVVDLATAGRLRPDGRDPAAVGALLGWSGPVVVNWSARIGARDDSMGPDAILVAQHQLRPDIALAPPPPAQAGDAEMRAWAGRCLAEHDWLSAQHGNHVSLWASLIARDGGDIAAAARVLRDLGDDDVLAGGLGYGGVCLTPVRRGPNADVPWQGIAAVTGLLDDTTPRHLLDISDPTDLFRAVDSGIDLISASAPFVAAAASVVYTNDGPLRIADQDCADSPHLLDPDITGFSEAFLHRLDRVEPATARTIRTAHNEGFLIELAHRIRASIADDAYPRFRDEFLERYSGNQPAESGRRLQNN